jgi:hypothetical protein
MYKGEGSFVWLATARNHLPECLSNDSDTIGHNTRSSSCRSMDELEGNGTIATAGLIAPFCILLHGIIFVMI